ncbi:MAG: nickel insertion protein, partial [Syntrophomonas sp.]
MNFLYFDCFSGVSGDMLVSALIDLGVDLKRFEEEMERLGLELSLSCQDVVFNGIKGTQFFINNTQSKTYRHLPEIRKIINNSSLKPSIKEKSLQVFIKLANAEASVHSISPEKIHFHEIGAIDTIVDIVGTFICLDLLGIEHV